MISKADIQEEIDWLQKRADDFNARYEAAVAPYSKGLYAGWKDATETAQHSLRRLLCLVAE